MRAHAAELVALPPDLILANTTPVVVALRQATRTIPIVCDEPCAARRQHHWICQF
jgi:hypothetical protein